ncbi:hypothetical protein EBA01_20235 [Xanthomonas oryzae pv. oryzae]|nr:hypothetical protein C0L89_20250 [Xanthomonas oryzae pv. oryzae]AVU04228.1 hypothetical protein C0L90_20310 [Xanthomonas oryzae pv. oryzae]QBI13808.1 hypothetical protein EYR02_20245 [Xanthomonas oryzae pv. oryzae]QBI17434.1 hypothetical protein EYR03_20605 [Xanthomonas oryzae pv. oryzae]QBN23665.1 hypothetical protein EBA00_02305 [Xanthomonas oryzae pv. oryzae]
MRVQDEATRVVQQHDASIAKRHDASHVRSSAPAGHLLPDDEGGQCHGARRECHGARQRTR